MKRCIVVGKPNAGKTLFVLNFAAYLRARSVTILFEDPAGARISKTYEIGAAVKDLVGPKPHTTRRLQSIVLELQVGKGRKPVELVDTTGFSEGIHADGEIRKAMAQTLAALRRAGIILHIIDAASIGKAGAPEALGEADYQVARFAQSRGGYCILANKMDLLEAKEGLAKLSREFPDSLIIPISALRSEGFREVKRFVLSQL